MSCLSENLSKFPSDEEFFWCWVNSHNFVSYLIENKHICKFSVADIPHNGSHGLCASCQLESIIGNIHKNREEIISGLHEYPIKTVMENYLEKYVGKLYDQ